ncbi:MAG TPA: VCBS repeat-containing protein, partial [Nannocystis exedens]|nr:VCBS repeat-containing protein [Nannocystis exedens]
MARVGFIGFVGFIGLLALAGCGGDDALCERRFGPICGLLWSSHSLAVVADDVVVIDLDGDGQSEHVLLDRQSSALSVLWSGSQVSSQRISGSLRGLASGDLDGDGQTEIVLAVDDPPRIKSLRWQGDVFEVGEEIQLSAELLDLAAADLDNDGLAEVIVAHPGGVAVVRVVEQKIQEYSVGRTIVALDLADLDGDGTLDLALVDFEGQALELLRGDGAGGFLPMASVPLGEAPEDLDLVDLNSDGAIDVVVRSRILSTFWIIKADGSGGFAAPQTLETGEQLSVGHSVLAIPGGESGLFGIATPGQLMRVAISDGGPSPVGQANVVDGIEGQVLGDGFVAGNGVLSEFEVREGPHPVVIQELPEASTIAAGDLDGDGFAELLTVSHAQPVSCRISLRRGGSAGLDEQAQPLDLGFGAVVEPGLGECLRSLKIIDINNDGIVDLLATGGSEEEFWLQIAYGIGDQIFEPGEPIVFENPGSPDPIPIMMASGWTFAFLQSGDFGAQAVEVDDKGEMYIGERIASGRHLWAAVAGDINGDSYEDFLLLSGAEARVVEVLLGGAAGLTKGPIISQEQLGLPV